MVSLLVSPDFLTCKEAADALRVTTRTVERYIASGALPAARLPGGLLRIPRSAVERLLTSEAVAP